MSFITNISAVSKYESKLLMRSWFFKIFAILSILILTIVNFVLLVSEEGSSEWFLRSIPSNISYFNILILNTGQSIIAIFLASDFIKRDKKLDTSEVFYVHPLSNAGYMAGKIWGNLRVFLLLNLIVMVISMVTTVMSPGVPVDWMSYIIYFLLICIPSLVFIIGLSVFLMLVLKNQALTFIILLGYIGLTLFYINNKYYYLFDYMAYYLPLLKSTIVGFTNLKVILIHRSIYLFAGLAFIFFSIPLFMRLPNSSRSKYPWLFLAVCMLAASVTCGYNHIGSVLEKERLRSGYIDINNKYVRTPKIIVDQYHITVAQHTDVISSEVSMKGSALQTSSVFAFCLNPGLEVLEVRSADKELRFERESQILLVDFGKEIKQADTVLLMVKYKGRIEHRFCYLDVPDEVMQKEYRYATVSVDKQYSFQTPDYLLLTPETYWYPRPGTSYSNENPEWQQVYFSKFSLTVKPLPGLIPLSQGVAADMGDGSFSFDPEYPAQAITLIAGHYQQESIMSDSVQYSIWHIGEKDFALVFDSISDTIPNLLKNLKEDFERTYKLNYPFQRFSIIEVPAQFYSYPRAWSRAQEVNQPEMLLFTEKGWLYDQADAKKMVANHIRWSKHRGEAINEKEALISTFKGFAGIFFQETGGHDGSSTGRGQYTIETKVNPFFLFPQLYNFSYNIFSSEWPVANRIIELYLQNKQDSDEWERSINGLSNNERANLLMEKQSFKELLAVTEHQHLLDNIISLRANKLFAFAELNIGVDVFRDSVFAALKRNTFQNIQFERLLDDLGLFSDTDIRTGLSEWTVPTPLPYYTVDQPEAVRVTNRGQESLTLKVSVHNISDYNGIIHLDIHQKGTVSDPGTKRKIAIPAHQSKQLVSVWVNEPEPSEIVVETMISGNLPGTIKQSVRSIKQERSTTEKEGDYLVSQVSPDRWGEVIVDNEDALFYLSDPVVMGYLPKWLDKVEDTSFKYSGYASWRPPVQWTATTHNGFYGRHIRSAYVIKSGNGSQTATWRVPVPSPGHYDVFYYVYKNDELKNTNSDAEYHFKVIYDQTIEDAYVDLKRASGGWEQIGAYFFESDTVNIVLTNECKIRTVYADAVKLVKR